MIEHEKIYTVACPFGGVGGGALGFIAAEARLFETRARFRCLGNIDIDPLACAGFEALTGSPALRADIATMTPAELRAFFGETAPDVVFSSPPCLPGNVPVVTADGPRAIETIRANDLVLTHRGRLRRVRAVGCEVYKGTVFGLRLNGTVDTQEFTAEHPIWVRRLEGKGAKRGLSAPSFVPASDVRRGDRVGFPIVAAEPGTARRFVDALGDPRLVTRGGVNAGRYTKPEHVAMTTTVVDLRERASSPALWFLIGAYLGDGYRRPSRNEVIYCVGADGGELAARVVGALAELGLTARKSDEGGPTNVKLHVNAKHLCEIVALFGDGAENKTIPEVLMSLESGLVDALIAGYRATDGSEQGRRPMRNSYSPARWRIVSVSLPLLRGLQRLLLRNGAYGKIHVAWPGGEQVIMGRLVNTRPRWEVAVNLEPTRRQIHEFIDGAVWIRVRDVVARAAEDGERVWNLDVDEDDTFCAPLIATHNCKGLSSLLSAKQAKTTKYRKLNRLVLIWTKLMLDAWPTPPRLVLIENVPRLGGARGRRILSAVKSLLRKAGYVFHAGTHECGELGGLAQRRTRFLLVARHPGRCAPLLYQPPKLRVRGCGEVLEKLPLPGEGGGPMHELPKLSWLNWVRLALIPAGGDWRDLPGVLLDGQPRREVFRRHHVTPWSDPAATVAGSGSNGPSAIADPRVDDSGARGWNRGAMGVLSFDEPAGTVTGNGRPSAGRFAVADGRIGPIAITKAQRVSHGELPMASGRDLKPENIVIPQAGNPGMHWGKYDVRWWAEPAATVIGATRVGSGAPSVADPRPAERAWYSHVYKVVPWSAPAGTVTGAGKPSSGSVSVADPRVGNAYDHGYGVLRLDEPSSTIAGGSHVGQGAYAVADARLGCEPRAGSYGVIGWADAAKTVTGSAGFDNGSFAVCDPRTEEIVMVVRDARKPPPKTPIIIAADGTWHRPLTTLELAALQGFPTKMPDGSPLMLGVKNGKLCHSHARELIGNAVPPPAAKAIAERMLIALLQHDLEAFALSGGAAVWVRPAERAGAHA